MLNTISIKLRAKIEHVNFLFEAFRLTNALDLKLEDWNKEGYWKTDLNQRYKDEKFKVGEDDEGYPVRIKLKYFLEYLVNQQDDSPLYLFESAIEDRKEAKKMKNDFEIPKYFRDDLFSIVGPDQKALLI